MNNPNEPATKRQLWALFCASRKDFRNEGLTKQQAHDMLQEFNENRVGASARTATGEGMKMNSKKAQEAEFDALIARADAAGEAAGKAWMEAALARGPAYGVMDNGVMIDTMLDVCGFAYVKFADKRSAFYRYLKKKSGRDGSLYSIPVTTSWSRRQEMGLAEAVKGAAAKVYQMAGIECYMSSRID